MPPLLPLEPTDAATAAAMLAHAAAEGTMVVPQGNGTKQPPFSSRGISTARLTTGLAHYAGDLVATVPAGCTLHEVNAALARERQWIPLDPPHAARATIGGIVATNDSGPRRHAYGAPRDLIIGIEVALTSGSVAHSGGRVVKNVAGYDLGRLFCGSRGSLGLITAVTFKLAPMAAASRTVVAHYAQARQAVASALDLARTPSLTPTCIELIVPDSRLLVRFETTERAVDLMAGSAAALLARDSTEVSILTGAAERAAWDAHQELVSAPDGLQMNTSVLPTAVPALLEALDHVAGRCEVSVTVNGRVALGVLRVRFTGESSRLARAASMTRDSVTKLGGHAEVTGGHDLLDPAFDRLGPLGSASSIALAVKQRFDPAGVLPWPWVLA